MEHTLDQTQENVENLKEETPTEETPESNEEKTSETISMQKEIEELKDKYMRLYSEFENFRRRTSKEKMDLINTASEHVILALLPIADDIDRARVNINEQTTIETIREGHELIFSKFYKVLESKGVKVMQAKGSEFNADLHEAITQIPAPTDDLKGKVVDEIEKGYFLQDKLIRVAKVVIGS